jgi:hypothetical protein
VLRDDLQRLENSSYPTAKCLTPDDFEDLLEGLQQRNLGIEVLLKPGAIDLIENPDPSWKEQLAHLATCDPCRILLAACLPNSARQLAFAEYVAKTFEPAVAKA